VEYVELPPDTIFKIDTVFNFDSTTINNSDTVVIHDTVVQTNTIYDTVIQTNYIYDTIVLTDTVSLSQCDPNGSMAFNALQYYCDPLVIEFVMGEFGYNDGWIYYLSSYQHELTSQSSNVFDIYGYIDYWTPDWSGFFGLEYYYRMTHIGGDPDNPENWQISEPPTTTAKRNPGITRVSINSEALPIGQ
jgi:hypothetical protein